MKGRWREWVLAGGSVVVAACGGRQVEPSGAATGVTSDAEARPDAPLGDTRDAGDAGDPADASAVGDADNQALCQDLENEAATQFAALVQQNLACTSDNDCTRISPGGDGECVALCGDVLANEAGAPTLGAAADTLCESFVAKGCRVPLLSCFADATLNICAAGTCEGWNASLSWNSAAPFTHGVCASFEIEFSTDQGTALAPHDLVFALTPKNGTLYADAACTTPLAGGSVTLPGGANSVAFGFLPLAASQSGFSGSGPDNAIIGVDFLAQ
jgi:hypothetical protein